MPTTTTPPHSTDARRARGELLVIPSGWGLAVLARDTSGKRE